MVYEPVARLLAGATMTEPHEPPTREPPTREAHATTLDATPRRSDGPPPPALAPEVWAPARRIAWSMVRPIEQFLHVQTSSGLILLAVAVLALAWANSPLASSYEHLWHLDVGATIGGHGFVRPLHFWINDGLMTIFFFVVGLEIRREMHAGELSEWKRALLPVAAAVGGMLAPAAIYASTNGGRPTAGGWGVPMATDIAFAVGVLALLGKRVPPALRVLLLALAVIDDLGAILVIALFYSSGTSLAGFGIAALGVAVIVAMQKIGLRRPWAYVPAGLVVWAGVLSSGVHPTIAGVVVGLVTPVRAWLGERGFVEAARAELAAIERSTSGPGHEHDVVERLEAIAIVRREAVPPVVRLQTILHPYVAFGIMPIFALANAGVDVRGVSFDPDTSAATIGVVLGLVVGKPIGIVAASLLVTKLGLASLPAGVGTRGLVVVGMVAGIGFTMAIFVAQLAYADPAHLSAAKLAVLVGSTVSAVIALAYGRFVLREPAADERVAATADEAERSTEL
jgi:NhaA family Na+:H+ antiporter